MLFLLRSLALLSLLTCGTAGFARADVTDGQRELLRVSFDAVQAAGRAFQSGDFPAAGEQLIVAMQNASRGLRDADEETFTKFAPILDRIEKAHTLLQLEGIVLPPFDRPQFGQTWQDFVGETTTPTRLSKPSSKENRDTASNLPKPPAPKPEMPATPDGPSELISFRSQVAPILLAKCGRCHVQQSRGQFSLASFAILMKGPPAGVVVFPGDPIGSRLIETIETGDMPRGGDKVSPAQLNLLKQWVTQGAKFDGPSPAAPLATYAQPLAASGNRPAPANRPDVQMATGEETVSFARDVAPLLVENCNGCHIDAMQVRGGLNMNTLAQLMRGGDSGAVIEPGSGDASLLVQKLRGEAGARMPAGGRPPLDDTSIALISKWIDEGAKLDSGTEDQPLRVMVTEAWAKNATHEELATRRVELARQHWKLAASGNARDTAVEWETDDVFLIGLASESQAKTIAKAAGEAISRGATVIPASREKADAGKAKIRGRVSLFVFPKRYDYGEFSKMVEGREVPGDWNVHWRYDGVEAYVSMVVSPEESQDELMARLVAPMASIQVAMRGDSPRWFREGLGRAVAAQTVARDLPEVQQWKDAIPQALTVIKEPKDIVEQRLPPAETDLIGFGMSQMLLDRQYRKQLAALLRGVESGMPFNEAFQTAFGPPLETFVTGWLTYYANNARR